jgi:hypothetical protein
MRYHSIADLAWAARGQQPPRPPRCLPLPPFSCGPGFPSNTEGKNRIGINTSNLKNGMDAQIAVPSTSTRGLSFIKGRVRASPLPKRPPSHRCLFLPGRRHRGSNLHFVPSIITRGSGGHAHRDGSFRDRGGTDDNCKPVGCQAGRTGGVALASMDGPTTLDSRGAATQGSPTD